MKRKEDLFNLINAMSRSEKRYFTIDAQKIGKKGNKYLELFQAINGMDEYDESKLKKKFPKNLHADKSYLYEAILRSMRDYRSATSRAARIKELILDYKYLYERGLYEQSEERLKEAKDLAETLSNSLSLLEINAEERRLLRNTKRRNYAEEIAALIREKQYRLHELEIELFYSDVAYQLSVEVQRHFEYKNEEQKAALREQFQVTLFRADKMPETPYAKRRFFLSGFLYFQLLGEARKMLDFCSNIVEWWDENENLKNEEFNWYVKDMANLLHALFRLNQFDYIPEILRRLEKEAPSSPHEQEVLFLRTTIYRLMYYINIGSPKEGRKLIREIDEGFLKYKMRLTARMVIIFNSALLLFLLKDYAACIEWCDRIIKEVKSSARMDIQAGIRILKLFAAYELDDIDAFELLYRSTYRQLTQNLNLNKDSFEISAIKSLSRIHHAPYDEQRELLTAFEQELEKSVRDETRVVALELDALLLKWIQSRLTPSPRS